MAHNLSEDTNVTLDLKTIGMIVGFTISLVTMYFTLKADIANAAELPKPEVTQVEFSYKDQLTRTVVEGVQADMTTIKEDVKEIKLQLDKMDERLYEISKN